MKKIADLQPTAEKLFADIQKISFDGIGITRESYGRSETVVAEYLSDFARSEGLMVSHDSAANLLFSLPGAPSDQTSIWIGSHLDSVPQGGNFDGLAGVIAGLLCQISLKRADQHCALPIQTIAFRGEESAWFGKANIGSRALLGKLSPADLELKHRNTGESLGSRMQKCGADVSSIRAQKALVDKTKIKAYIELHIEQGPVMVTRDLPLAVVSNIRGNVRHSRVECFGHAQHSGVVPRCLRHDSVFAVSHLLMQLDMHWKELLERGTDLVVTAGIFHTDPAEHSISRIPGYVRFSLEARSKSTETLEFFYQLFQDEVTKISRERGVQFKFDSRLTSEPADMDETLRSLLTSACAEQRIDFELIASGAGHDAAVFANVGVPSGMLFVRNENGSHNPHEAMEIGDFMLGVQALYSATSRIN